MSSGVSANGEAGAAGRANDVSKNPADSGAALPKKTLDRQIFALALPALGTLVAEPLLLAVDSAMVGHLGTSQLAALAIATSIVATLVGFFIFLTYTTTAGAAKLLGAGDRVGALRMGIDGMWLAGLLGVGAAVFLGAMAPRLVSWMGARGEVADHAATYLYASAPGLVGMLVVLGATGALRGLLDARTPFLVSVGGAVLNGILNALLIYGLGWGIAGSGAGTALSQTLMATALIWRVAAGARRAGVTLAPRRAGLAATWREGWALMVRTFALLVSLLATVRAASLLGDTQLAAYQVLRSSYVVFSYPPDAFAMAAQSLVGLALGSGSREQLRAVVRRVSGWAIWFGVALGVVLALGAGVLPRLFNSDPAVTGPASAGLWVVAALLPLSSAAFILDGVLIGAGQSRFLANATLGMAVIYVPAVFGLVGWMGSGFVVAAQWQLVALAAAFMLGFLGLRAAANIWATRRLLARGNIADS